MHRIEQGSTMLLKVSAFGSHRDFEDFELPKRTLMVVVDKTPQTLPI
jgi:hypothetical protein